MRYKHILLVGGGSMSKSQTRISVTFPENELGKELYNWIKEKGQITNDAAFIRQVLYEKMIEDKTKNK